MSEENKAGKGYKWLVELMTSKGMGSTLAKIIAGAIIGILAALGFVSCSNITSEQVQLVLASKQQVQLVLASKQQVQTVHDLYHEVSNKPCIFVEKNGK